MKPEQGKVTIHVPLTFVARGGRKMIVSQASNLLEDHVPDRRDAAVEALARAFHWKALLECGRYASVADLARSENQKVSKVYNLLRLSLLAPRVIEGILGGKVSSARLKLSALSSMSWDEQCSILKNTG